MTDRPFPRLSAATLDRLHHSVERLGYDRSRLKPGIVHLGIGAFHRAHQAVVYDDLIRAGDDRWGVLGVSMRSAAVRDQLAPQDGLYTVSVRDGAEVRDRVIGAVTGVLTAPGDPAAVVRALADPATYIVTLTVTEKGYRLDPASGLLNRDDPDVLADLASLSNPRTAPGLIASALSLRRARGLPALTAVSCDNLPHNGARLQAAVLALATASDPHLGDWIERQAAFPQTMVDRIVPATDAADLAEFARRSGVCDHGLVKTEPFTQWVVEDRFAGPRPDLAAGGVQLTSSVAPWEDAKLRLLNGAHSAIAYLGGLAGFDFVHEVIARPGGARMVERLWDESQTTLRPPDGLDLATYRAALMARFRNPALQHRTRQIAMDGSQKLPQRLLAPIAERLERGQSIDTLALAVAAWIRWLAGRDDQGQAIALQDPLADRLTRTLTGARGPSDQVAAILKIDAVFTRRLADNPVFVLAVTTQLDRLARDGAVTTLARLG